MPAEYNWRGKRVSHVYELVTAPRLSLYSSYPAVSVDIGSGEVAGQAVRRPGWWRPGPHSVDGSRISVSTQELEELAIESMARNLVYLV